jgi:2,3-bisphosphoglycerate-independent phosphoglycerate mutase
VDKQLKIITEQATAAGYTTIITADHGVLEQAIKPGGYPSVSHTHNPVPFLIIGPGIKKQIGPVLRKDGKLFDIAPTVLQLLRLPKPELMTGQSLFINDTVCPPKSKVLLLILDGWGIGEQNETNPIYMANTPVWDRLLSQYPFTSLQASGRAVGLLDWKPGNSEAGHISIGSGREVPQDDVRINHSIENGTFYQNSVFLDAIDTVKTKNTSLHLISLLSKKSSHGSLDYSLALLKLAKNKDLKNVFFHVIFDGRSTKVRNAPDLLKKLADEIKIIGTGQIASGIGRSFALDRDGNYQKTRQAYNAFVQGLGLKVKCR